VTVEMMRCQAEAFHFSKGHFGLTVYEQGVTHPTIDDQVYWIDAEESAWNRTSNDWAAITAYALGDHVYSSVGDGYECTFAGISGVGEPVWDTDIGATTADGAVIWTRVVKPTLADRDVGRWTVIIGTGVGGAVPAPGTHVAVRYWPEIEGDCCFCRSYKVRVEIEPKAEAYSYYETEVAMRDAVDRLQGKILAKLLPIHARVAEWVVTTEWVVFMGSVQAGWVDTRFLDADEWVDMGPAAQILLSIEQRGDLLLGPQTQTMTMTDGVGAPLVPPINTGPVNTGHADPTTWYPVAGYDPAAPADVTDSLLGILGTGVLSTRAIATGTAGVTYGEVRWTFRVTRGTLG